MHATGRSCAEGEFSPEERHAEIAAILAAGLARIVQDGQNIPAEKNSESGEKGLELSGETRLSVPNG